MRNLLATLLCGLLLISVQGVCNATATLSLSDANTIFSHANASYRAQKYEDAAAGYRQLLQAGYDSAPVLYNLGTAAARLDNRGEALAYLTRAHLLQPRDENIAANLHKVKLEHAEASGLSEEAAAAAASPNILGRIVGYFTAEEWLLMMWAATLIASIGGFLLLVVHKPAVRTTATALIVIGVICLVLLAGPGLTQVYRTRITEKAIAMMPGEVLSGPAERFTKVAPLQEGQVVRSLGRHEAGYHHVMLDNGLQGYVESGKLVDLTP